MSHIKKSNVGLSISFSKFMMLLQWYVGIFSVGKSMLFLFLRNKKVESNS